MQPLGLVLILALNHVLISALIVVLVSVLKNSLVSTDWFYNKGADCYPSIRVDKCPISTDLWSDKSGLYHVYTSTDASSITSADLYPNKQKAGS